MCITTLYHIVNIISRRRERLKIEISVDEIKELIKTPSAGTLDVSKKKIILQDVNAVNHLHNFLGQLLQEQLDDRKPSEKKE